MTRFSYDHLTSFAGKFTAFFKLLLNLNCLNFKTNSRIYHLKADLVNCHNFYKMKKGYTSENYAIKCSTTCSDMQYDLSCVPYKYIPHIYQTRPSQNYTYLNLI